jgi:hypothetical protein
VQFAGKEADSDWRVFIAAENQIFCYDLRNSSQPKVIWKPEEALCRFYQHIDEINQIQISLNGNHLASVDDSGAVSVFGLHRLDDRSSLSNDRPLRPERIFTHGPDDTVRTNVF